MLRKLDLLGNPFLGVFCKASESVAVVPFNSPDGFAEDVSETLSVPSLRVSVDSTDLVGSLLCINSQCAIVSQFAYEREVESLSKHVRVFRMPHRLNAVGNNILVNDRGALVHPGYDDKTLEKIANCLGVAAERGTIAGMGTVGSAAIATNKGVVCHPKATEQELENVRRVLKVPATIGTANYGSVQVGACVIANSKGAVVGMTTTPIEIGRIEDGLGLY